MLGCIRYPSLDLLFLRTHVVPRPTLSNVGNNVHCWASWHLVSRYAGDFGYAVSGCNRVAHVGIRYIKLDLQYMQDISGICRFDALVKRVKKQDRIDEILATKKAQGLAIMLISRRRYLRERDERRDRQILNMSVVGDLLPPRERTVGDIMERGDHEDRRASSVPEVMPSKRSDHDDRRASSMPQGMLSSLSRSPSPGNSIWCYSEPDNLSYYWQRAVPAIVVQQTQFPETSLRFPPRYPSQVSSPPAANSAYRSRRASESSSMRQQRTLPTRSPSLSPPATVHPMAVSPFSSSRRATVDENIFSDASIDAFTRYYVSDINPNMPQSDAIDLINTLKHNSWSGKESSYL